MNNTPLPLNRERYPHQIAHSISYPSEHKHALLQGVKRYCLSADLPVQGEETILVEFPWGRALLWADSEPKISIRYESTEFKYLQPMKQTIEQAMAAFRIDYLV